MPAGQRGRSRGIRRSRVFRASLTLAALGLAGAAATLIASGLVTVTSASPITSTATNNRPGIGGISSIDSVSLDLEMTTTRPDGAGLGLSQTAWFTGSATLDTDGDGEAEETVYFAVGDAAELSASGDTADGVFDTVDVSVGDETFGEGDLADNQADVENDERLFASGTHDVNLGSYKFTFSFPVIMNNTGSSSSISIFGDEGALLTSVDVDNSPYDGSLRLRNATGTIDGVGPAGDGLDYDCDATCVAPQRLHSLAGRVGSGEWFYIGTNNTVAFGSGDLSLAYNDNDGASPHEAFTVVIDPGVTVGTASIESKTWYTGTVTVDIDGVAHTLDFAFVDTDSDGLFETLNIDADDNGLFDSEEALNDGDAILIGDEYFVALFGLNPADSEFTLEIDDDYDFPDDPGEEDEEGGEDAFEDSIDELIDDLLEGEELTDEELDLLESMEVPDDPADPSPGDAIRTIDGQPLVAGEMVLTIDPDRKDAELLAKRVALALKGEIVGSIPRTGTFQLKIPAETPDLIERISGLADTVPGVESAQAHWLVEKFGSRAPNDALYGKPLAGKPYLSQWDLEYIKLPQAWDVTVGSPDVPVAVIDADIDITHSDLRGNARSFFGKRSAAGGHGTHVAGTACAQGNDGIGVAGVAWECSLRLYDFGAASAVLAQDAMVEAVDEGARVINISAQWVDNNKCGTLGTAATIKRAKELNATFAPAFKYAQKKKKDVLWVIAAGNECRDTKYASPASSVGQFPDNIIVVASIGPDGRLSSFSNFGELVDVAAPGGEILSAVPRECSPECHDDFEVLSGTSMAAPHVTGVAALMLSVDPSISAKEMKSCLLRTVQHQVAGHPFGVIDASASVNCAKR